MRCGSGWGEPLEGEQRLEPCVQNSLRSRKLGCAVEMPPAGAAVLQDLGFRLKRTPWELDNTAGRHLKS